jgi:membrane protein YqaA with SNARE-associated domain
MRFLSLLGYFWSPAGLVVLGALDASVIFFLPLGIDFVLVLLSAQRPSLFWAYALSATAGSLLGAAATYWIGHKVGEKGLARWVGASRLKRVQQRMSSKAAPGVGLLGIIPPPFPFTAFVLASGAFALDAWKLLGTLAVMRLLRFGAEASLAARFGHGITAWMESTVFKVVVGLFIAVAVVGTAVSAFRILRKR